jgi:hypothetical protein
VSILVLFAALAFAVIVAATAFVLSLWLWRHDPLKELDELDAEYRTRPHGGVKVIRKP